MSTQVKVGWRSFVSPVTSSYLLDTYAGATAAYSLRKLRTAYTGSAIRVRRSSDNTEQNIGFTSTGGLDTAALLSFVGAGNGFVTTWYDQGASGYNLTQSIASNQPSIVLSGVLNTQNSKPVLITDFNSFMTNGSLPLNGTTNSIFNVIKLTATRGAFAMMSGYSSYNQHWPSRDASGNNRYYDSGGSNITASPLPNGYNLINLHENASGITVYENNSNLVTNFAHDVISTTGIFIFRRDVFDGNYMPNGSGYSELVIYGNSSKLSDNSGISSNINSYYSIYSTLDTDAQAFITAASITDATQVSAVNTLVTSLKSSGIWTKMKAIYPFVGGTATSHKFNLKDPRDVDAAFRLQFYGGGTHGSNGFLQNYVNSWADTKFTPSNNFSSASKASFGIYSRTLRADNNRIAMGSNSGTGWIFIWLRNGNSTTTYVNSNFPAGSAHTTAQTNTTKGFFQSARNNSTTEQLLNVNNVNYNSTANSSSLSTNSIFIGSINGLDSGQYVDNLEIAFAYIGDDLSPTDLTNYYNAVQAFQTTLGRQV